MESLQTKKAEEEPEPHHLVLVVQHHVGLLFSYKETDRPSAFVDQKLGGYGTTA